MLFTVLSNQVLSQENEQYQAILYYEIIDNNQSEALDTGDVINFILTATNTGNVGGDGGAYNYTFNDFDANQITLSDNSFVNGYQLEVGEQVESSASYSISEQSLSSGGVERRRLSLAKLLDKSKKISLNDQNLRNLFHLLQIFLLLFLLYVCLYCNKNSFIFFIIKK